MLAQEIRKSVEFLVLLYRLLPQLEFEPPAQADSLTQHELAQLGASLRLSFFPSVE